MDLTEDIKNFDQLPNSAFVRLPVVKILYACSSATVWRNSKKDGRIPEKVKLTSRVTGWNVGELRKSLGSKVSS